MRAATRVRRLLCLCRRGENGFRLASREPLSTGDPSRTEWKDLQRWRCQGVERRRSWRQFVPVGDLPSPGAFLGVCDSQLPCTLAEAGRLVLSTADPLLKCELTHAAFALWSRGGMPVGVAEAPARPARPARPRTVPPRDVPAQKSSGLPLNAYVRCTLSIRSEFVGGIPLQKITSQLFLA